MELSEIKLSLKRLDQKSEAWKNNVRRIYPAKNADDLFYKIRPYHEEAHKIGIEALSESKGTLDNLDLTEVIILKRCL